MKFVGGANVSQFSDTETARTRPECATQRFQNLAILGSRKVLELCVGPSLRDVTEAGRPFGIEVVGNDIDQRWQRLYPEGKWIIGDALKISLDGFDTLVFAPPLSRGCSGKREDSLRVDQVTPSYGQFLSRSRLTAVKNTVLVLPARSLATKRDRTELHKLLADARSLFDYVEPIPLMADGIRKYLDVYCY
jgi:hypothetical protein